MTGLPSLRKGLQEIQREEGTAGAVLGFCETFGSDRQHQVTPAPFFCCSGRAVCAAGWELEGETEAREKQIKNCDRSFLVRMAPWETKLLIHKCSR